MEDPIYFSTPLELRNWLVENHLSASEAWIGFYKKGTGIRSISWSESVDQALCFGWIDGIRKKVDSLSYKIRFTPRNPKSHWSAINLEKIKQLKKENRLEPAGLKVYNIRNSLNEKKASFEQEPIELSKEFYKVLSSDKVAFTYYNNLAPSYQKISRHWVMRAVKEETKQRRFNILLKSCEEGKKIPMLRKKGE